MNSFDEHWRDMKKAHRGMAAVAVGWMLFVMSVSIAVLGFVGWVIVKLLTHWGVV